MAEVITHALGSDIKAFYHDETVWTEGLIHDEHTLKFYDGSDDESWVLKPDELYPLHECGEIYNDLDGGEWVCSFAQAFQQWKAAQTHTRVLLSVPHDALETVRAICAEHGWDVLSQ